MADRANRPVHPISSSESARRRRRHRGPHGHHGDTGPEAASNGAEVVPGIERVMETDDTSPRLPTYAEIMVTRQSRRPEAPGAAVRPAGVEPVIWETEERQLPTYAEHMSTVQRRRRTANHGQRHAEHLGGDSPSRYRHRDVDDQLVDEGDQQPDSAEHDDSDGIIDAFTVAIRRLAMALLIKAVADVVVTVVVVVVAAVWILRLQ